MCSSQTVFMTEGRAYAIEVVGGNSPALKIIDKGDKVLAEDKANPRGTSLQFVAPATGTYHLVVSAAKAGRLLTQHWSASSWRARADILRTAEWLVGISKQSAASGIPQPEPPARA